MSDKEKPVGLMVRLPPELHAEVVRMSKGGSHRPATSLNNTVIFILERGLDAIRKADQEKR